MPPQHPSASALLRELNGHNSFFDELVNMFPAKLYIAGNSGDSAYNPKYLKGQHKESKEARRARNKAGKAIKFDPNRSETTREEQSRKVREDEDDSDSDSDSGDMEIESDPIPDPNTDPSSKETVLGINNDSDTVPNGKTVTTDSSTANIVPGMSRIENLRSKLQRKIQEQKSRRHASADGGDESHVTSKRAARRAERMRRLSAGPRPPRSGSTQVGNARAAGGRFADSAKGAIGGINADTPRVEVDDAVKIKDDLSTIDFGGLAGLNGAIPHRRDNKSLSNLGKKKSLERLLEDAERKKERLKELKASEREEDKEKAKSIEWGDSFKAASGTTTKDTDPALLKKAIKRKFKKKEKSQKAWKSRMEQTRESIDERQKIRGHNLDQRRIGGAAGANLSKKRINDEDGKGADDSKGGTTEPGGKKRARLGPHAGKGRAGFEGKKQDFINKSNKGKSNDK